MLLDVISEVSQERNPVQDHNPDLEKEVQEVGVCLRVLRNSVRYALDSIRERVDNAGNVGREGGHHFTESVSYRLDRRCYLRRAQRLDDRIAEYLERPRDRAYG